MSRALLVLARAGESLLGVLMVKPRVAREVLPSISQNSPQEHRSTQACHKLWWRTSPELPPALGMKHCWFFPA